MQKILMVEDSSNEGQALKAQQSQVLAFGVFSRSVFTRAITSCMM